MMVECTVGLIAVDTESSYFACALAHFEDALHLIDFEGMDIEMRLVETHFGNFDLVWFEQIAYSMDNQIDLKIVLDVVVILLLLSALENI